MNNLLVVYGEIQTSAAHHDLHAGLGVELGHFVTIGVDTAVCFILHLALADQTLAHLSTIKRGDLNELISQTSSRVEINLHGALNELHGVSLDYLSSIEHEKGAARAPCDTYSTVPEDRMNFCFSMFCHVNMLLPQDCIL